MVKRMVRCPACDEVWETENSEATCLATGEEVILEDYDDDPTAGFVYPQDR